MSKTEIPPVAIDLDGATDIGADIVDADLFLIDDGAGGTMRKTTASRIKTYASGLTGVTTGSGNVTITDGNLIVASGHGIDFSATSNSGAGSNIAELFDDYEEGTFLPSVAPTSGAFSAVGTVLGFYTKIGRMVHIQCSITITNVGNGSANMDLTGLPFTSASTGPVHTMMTCARETQVQGQNDEVIMSRDVSAAVILGAHFGNGMEYSVNFIYRAAT
tara:strand:+ start:1012 stop:1665 length:654 start_codon:yes stop_codon:yes gene_type:complete